MCSSRRVEEFRSDFNLMLDLLQDIPDIDGDKIYGIRSFSVRLGQKRVSLQYEPIPQVQML